MMLFFSNFLKFLFLMTPFFVLSMFLSMTPDWNFQAKKKLAIRVGLASMVICLVLLFFGKLIFQAFGITLDSFRIGGGVILFLSAIGLVNSNVLDKKNHSAPVTPAAAVQNNPDYIREISKIAVVPLAIPVTVGPATIAPLMVLSAEAASIAEMLLLSASLIAASFVLTLILLLSGWLEEKMGLNVIIVLSKLTGLILAAMASQMIFTGIMSFIRAS